MKLVWALLCAAMLVWVNGERKAPENLKINVEVFHGWGYSSYFGDHRWWAMRVISGAQRLLDLFSGYGTKIELNVFKQGTFRDKPLSQITTDTLTSQRQKQKQKQPMTDMFIYFAYDKSLNEAVIRKLGLGSSMCGNDETLRTLVLNEGYGLSWTLSRALAYYVGTLLGMKEDPHHSTGSIMNSQVWSDRTNERWNQGSADDFKKYVKASTTTSANGKRSRFCSESIPQSLTVRLWASYDSRYKASIPVGEDAKTNIEETVAEAQKLLNKGGTLGRTFNLAMTTSDINEMATDFNYDPNVQDNMKGPLSEALLKPSRQVGAGGEFDVYFTYLDAMPMAHASINRAICHNDKRRRTIILTRENFENFGAARHLAYYIARAFGIGYDLGIWDKSSNYCYDGLMLYKHSTHRLSNGKWQKFGPPSQELIKHYKNKQLTWNKCNFEDLEFAFYWKQRVADCFFVGAN